MDQMAQETTSKFMSWIAGWIGGLLAGLICIVWIFEGEKDAPRVPWEWFGSHGRKEVLKSSSDLYKGHRRQFQLERFLVVAVTTHPPKKNLDNSEIKSEV